MGQLGSLKGYKNLMLAIFRFALKDINNPRYKQDVEEFMSSERFELFRTVLMEFRKY